RKWRPEARSRAHRDLGPPLRVARADRHIRRKRSHRSVMHHIDSATNEALELEGAGRGQTALRHETRRNAVESNGHALHVASLGKDRLNEGSRPETTEPYMDAGPRAMR